MRVEGLPEAVRAVRKLKDNMDSTVSKALNRVGQGVMTEAAKTIREKYTVKLADVKPAMQIVYASPSSGEVLIKVKGRNLLLTKFKYAPKNPPAAKKRQKPVTVSVLKAGGGRIRSAFLTRRSSGEVGIWKRRFPTGQSGRRRELNRKGDRPEMPIDLLRGPAVPVMASEPQVVAHIEEQARVRMDKRLDHEIKRLLGVPSS